MHFFRMAVIDPLKLRAGADGPVDRKRAQAQHLFEFIEQGKWLAHGPVALVHEGEDGHAPLTANLEELARLRLDALGGVDNHDH